MTDLIISLELTEEQKTQFNTPVVNIMVQECFDNDEQFSFFGTAFLSADGEVGDWDVEVKFKFLSGEPLKKIHKIWSEEIS